MSHISAKKKINSAMQNIKVVVRVRPLSNDEKEKRVKTVVHCTSRKDVQTKEKKYQFDQVFPPDSSQMDIYQYVVSPMISDVLAGYNCTVFAYGQTGTGKTHTMIGSHPNPDVHWKNDAIAGCIPRAAANIFDEITLMDTIDYNVRVSFLELYNEEVRDLLSEDDRPLPLNIFNDPKGSVYIQGLNEVTAFNANDIYALLQKGTMKRETAATLMNNHSSRSHTVFTIVVHTRESTLTGEEVLKTGKINLVDLAGSENIAKSGAKDKRAVELANINKSLLTLGRVIQILAERNNKHVPYRDSKLTRILQDSLGGHTKTCIIATVSPSHTSYEETCSTLEYACRARDIKNTPTVNEKVTKAQMMKEMSHEIEKLKKDLEAARAGDGFFIDKDNWEEMENEKQTMSSTLSLKNEMIEEMKKKLADLEAFRELKAKEFDQIMTDCQKKDKLIFKAKTLLKEQKLNLRKEQYVANCYAAAATENAVKANELLEVTKKLSGNQAVLQEKLERQYFNNYRNEQIIKDKSANLSNNLNTAQTKVDNLKNICRDVVNNSVQELNSFKGLTNKVCSAYCQVHEVATDSLKQLNITIDMLNKLKAQLRRDKIKKIEHIEEIDNEILEYQQKILEFKQKIVQAEGRKCDVNKEIGDIDMVLEEIDSLEESSCKENGRLFQKSERLSPTNGEEEIIELRQNNQVLSKSIEENEREIHTYKMYIEELERKLSRGQNFVEQNNVEPHMTSDHMEHFKHVNHNLSNKIQSIESHWKFLETTVDNDTKELNSLLELSNETVKKDILEKIVPVQRAGDTPKQHSVNYPKRIGDGALPRDALIKKFKDEFSEDIENESFHLNVSMDDSVQPLDVSIDETKFSPKLPCDKI